MTTPVPGPPASVLSAILVTNPEDPDSPLSVAVFSQSGQAPLLPSLANDVVAMPQDAQLDANGTWSGFLSTEGLTGATAPARWVGATAAGAPVTGTFSVGDFIVSGDGNAYVCTVAGSPGTWVASGSGVTGTASGDLSGTYPGPSVANSHYATQSISAAATLGGTSAPVVLTNTTTAAFTLTLPGSPTTGRLYIIVDDTGTWNTHNLTIARNGKLIDGAAANLTLTSQWGKATLYYDGTAWWTLSAWPALTSVTATDTSIVVAGTASAPTVATGTLDVIATQHPPAANWSNNSKKITSLANGSASSDAAAFGQIPVVDSTATDITLVGTAQGAGSIGKWADAGHTHADPNPLPADFGWVAWSADPGGMNGTGAPNNNVITLMMVFLRKTATISNIIVATTTAGTSLTSGQNFAGIYDSTGTRQGVTADQSTAWAAATGAKVMALTSAFTNAPAGTYYVAILTNGTGTVPSFRLSAGTGALPNAGLSGAALRFSTNGTGTTLPSSLTLSSNVATNNTPIGVVLS